MPRYVLSTDPQLQRLRPYAQSPVTWFRNPYATLIVVSAGRLMHRTWHVSCERTHNRWH